MALDGAHPHYLLTDKGYDGAGLRQSLLLRGILPVIPPKSSRREPIECDFRRYRDRNRIARIFGRIKQFRRIATRYNKTALSFLGFLHLAAARLWLPTFVNRAENIQVCCSAIPLRIQRSKIIYFPDND